MIRRCLPFLLVAIAGLALAGGSYTGPSNATQLRGKAISSSAPTGNQFLMYDATTKTYRPASVALLWFMGHSGAGSCTEPSALAGGHVLDMIDGSSPGSSHIASSFESVLTVNGQVQQLSSANLSSANIIGVVAYPQ